MKLINARPSPFGRKIAIALLEKGISFDTIWDEPWGRETCVAEYNPLAQLPILIADDGEALFDSTYILEWIERRYPLPPLMPADDNGILEAKKLMVMAEGVMTAFGNAAMEVSRDSPSEAWLARQRPKISAGIDWIAGQIGDKNYAVRDTLSQADIAIVCNLALLTFAREHNGLKVEATHWRERLPGLARYVDRLESRSTFQSTRPQPMHVELKRIVG
jgi:glutathione S-transferase